MTGRSSDLLVDVGRAGPRLDAVPLQDEAVLAEYFDGDVLLCHPDGTAVQVLNATAADVWVLIDGRRSIRDIAAILAVDYGVPIARCEADVVSFVGNLMARALVRLS